MKKLFVLSLLVIAFLGVKAQNIGTKGFFEVNYSFASYEYAEGRVLANASYGVELCDNHLFTGVGAGLGFSTEKYPIYSLPIYADVRYSFTNSNVKPFIAGKIGYAFLSSWRVIGGPGYSGGLYASPSVGVAISAFNRSDIIVNVGYTYHSATKHWTVRDVLPFEDFSEKFNAGGLQISLGLSF